MADTYNNLIRNIDPGGIVRSISGSVLAIGEFGFPHGFYRDGNIETALFNRPTDMIIDNDGRIIIADSKNNTIRVIIGSDVFTLSGSEASDQADGIYRNARFSNPAAIALAPSGNIYVADTFNHTIRRVTPNGTATTIAGVPGTGGHRDGAQASALFNYPSGIAVAPNGTIFVADTGNNLIRVIEGNSVRTLAGRLIFPGEINWEEPSDFDNVPVGGFADGIGRSAMFNLPKGLAFYRDTLIVADSANHRIRAVMPNGQVITVVGTGEAGHAGGSALAAELHFPSGVHIRDSRLYIADTGNNLIRIMELDSDSFGTTLPF